MRRGGKRRQERKKTEGMSITHVMLISCVPGVGILVLMPSIE